MHFRWTIFRQPAGSEDTTKQGWPPLGERTRSQRYRLFRARIYTGGYCSIPADSAGCGVITGCAPRNVLLRSPLPARKTGFRDTCRLLSPWEIARPKFS